jgi:neopullulanase
LLLGSVWSATAQTIEVSRIEPPFWWTGMKNTHLQLMVYGQGIASVNPTINWPGITIDSLTRTGNNNYLFVNITIGADAQPGSFQIVFEKGGKRNKPLTAQYSLKSRDEASALRKGFGLNDVIYMLMPDRFANGDPTNDNIPGMLEKADRSNPDGRHGGDLRGLMNHADYFNTKVGATMLWINPLLENNMPSYSYHGYAITDYYKIDPRFGTNEDYRTLSDLLKKHNTGLIMDAVFNHCGLNHWWMKDLPTSTWIHSFPEFTRSNYRAETLMDPYASSIDRSEMLTGWFDHGMPDLNQKDPLLATYLIQNTIWWIEYANLNGIRMDTWPYADARFLANWISAVTAEYPHFTILGEAWLQKESHTAYFQANPKSNINPEANLRYLTDFPLHYAMNRAFREQESWTGGVADLYYVLSQDFIYHEPQHLMTFLDNHDVMRFFTAQEKNINRWELAVTFLLTTRGIPVIYYGTEILMEGDKSKGDADLRRDFPGGWAGDSSNAFTGAGMTQNQQFAAEYFAQLARWRTSGLFSGNLVHYVPRDGVYVYFRSDQKSKGSMIILNNRAEQVNLDLSRFRKELQDVPMMLDVRSNRMVPMTEPLSLPPKSAMILTR